MCKEGCPGKEKYQSAVKKKQIIVADGIMLRAEEQLLIQLHDNEDNETVKSIFSQMQSFLQEHHLEGKQLPTVDVSQLYKSEYGVTDLWELEMPLGLTVYYSYTDGKIVIVDVI